jgi:hypothetical protein
MDSYSVGGDLFFKGFSLSPQEDAKTTGLPSCGRLITRFTVLTFMEGVPKVTVIGTCRVHHPLRNLEQRGKITLNNGGLGSFVHSSPEALLRLRVLLGLESYDKQFVKLQVGEAKDLRLTPEDDFDFSETDLLVVELSTIKALSLLGQPLQFNEVNRHMCTPYDEFGKAIRKNLNVAFNTRAPSVEFPEIDAPENYPKEYIDLIKELKPLVLDSFAISTDINEMRKLADVPILLVNHINLPGSNGKLITSRNKLCNIINQYAEREGVEVFNPAEMFRSHAPEELLMNDGKDLNHYAKDKLHIVGDIQLETILHALG